MRGRVVLVGAGPGDPDLLTVRALREIQRAEVLLYDALISDAILSLADPSARRVDVGKRGDGTRGIAQERIAELLIEHARSGAYVVRLKGGDPFVFGRGGEEASALAEAGIPFEVVPGVSSAIAVPAYAGIPLTDRRSSSSFTVVTGHRGKSLEDDRTDWEGLARSSETLVVLMGSAWVEDIAGRVLAGGRSPDTPAAVISHGTTGEQRTLRAPLGSLARAVREAELGPPAIIVIGQVAAWRESLGWFEKRPLFGRRLLVLRESERGPNALGVRLAASGALPVCVPLIEFRAPLDAGAALRAALEEVAKLDWLLLTSAVTVRFLVDRLGDAAPVLSRRRQAETGPRVACIGAATAEAARRAGLRVDVVPSGEGGGPGPLADALGDVAGARILIPRSDRASGRLPGLLERRGARVEAPTAYRNVLPEAAASALEAAFRQDLSGVLLTSPSTFERLAELRGADRVRGDSETVPFFCIGETTERAVRECGARVAGVARNTSLESLVEAVTRYYQPEEDAHGVP